ncbi:MAG: ferredoxin [Clostridia bacterium]|nr:ferredoxin [Clostridia bacterium]
MIANYGYKDGSGEFYISIDTDKCTTCSEKGCLESCPGQIFEMMVDDWDDEVAAVKASERNKIKMTCAACKPTTGRPELLPCQAACKPRGITHSW